jgi:hypothetical protein
MTETHSRRNDIITKRNSRSHRIAQGARVGLPLLALVLCLLVPGMVFGEDAAKEKAPETTTGNADESAAVRDPGQNGEETPAESVPPTLEERLDNTREALDNWVETQQEIAETRRELAFKKEFLKERISVLKQQIESAKERIAEAEAQAETAESEAVKLKEENEVLEASEDKLMEQLLALEDQTRRLLARLPNGPKVEEGVEKLAQRLPTAEKPEESRLPIPQRYLTITGILNEMDKYNLAIHLVPEVFERNGKNVEVTVMYVGLGQSYYLQPKSGFAGVGTATDDQWKWTDNDKLATDVAQAIAVFGKKEKPAFISLPVELYP